MANIFYVIFLLGMISSCQGKPDGVKNDLNNRLFKSSKEFVTEDGEHIDDEYGSTQEFEKQNLKVKYTNDTIYAQAVQYVNACGEAIAWIAFNGDTLVLTTKEQKEQLCTSGNWYKYEYWIKNIENKKFVIKQE